MLTSRCFRSSGTEEFWGQRSEVFHRTSFPSPTDLEIRQEPASSGSSKGHSDYSNTEHQQQNTER
ncbi:hypothetical protein F7725_023599 [Dissostichus mawsoni]|uniref:Uncharacterized protein n=1 Tax=Dissostichus mawsoni TaxID=36200 RepID=A0A7J5XZW5_DISMA|nr:hypothetical protein F7725_023599 [Dissostichus mawsoni]